MKVSTISLRRALVVAALMLTATVATQKAAFAAWQPYALTGSETTITVSKSAGRTNVRVKITLPNPSYRVTVPTTASVDPNTSPLFYFISVAAEHDPAAITTQNIVTVIRDYDLGVLDSTKLYYFTIYQSLSPTVVKQTAFYG